MRASQRGCYRMAFRNSTRFWYFRQLTLFAVLLFVPIATCLPCCCTRVVAAEGPQQKISACCAHQRVTSEHSDSDRYSCRQSIRGAQRLTSECECLQLIVNAPWSVERPVALPGGSDLSGLRELLPAVAEAITCSVTRMLMIAGFGPPLVAHRRLQATLCVWRN